MCLIERCRAAQHGYTPLHNAAMKGHATVVEQLLAAGAVTDAKTEVKRAWDEGCIGQGRGSTRDVLWRFFSGFFRFRSRLNSKSGFLCLVK